MRVARQARRLGKPKRGLGWIDPTGANMTVAFNTSSDSYYGPRRYANVVLGMDSWTCVTISGAQRLGVTFVPFYAYTNSSGTWSQYQGTLFGDGDGTGTDAKYFRAAIASTAYGMPAGLYTIFNPSGQEFAFGTFGGQGIVTWTTAKYLTFTYTPGAAGMYLWSRRSLKNTGAGNLQIILPGCVGNGTVNTTAGTYALDGSAGITSGNPWNPDYLAFHLSLGTHHIRVMDAMSTNTSVVQDFADRVLPTSISYLSQHLTGHEMPHELAIDLANRTGIDPWVNLPQYTSISADYNTKCAALYRALLDPNRRVLPEYLNESWNFFGSFGTGTTWVTYSQYTKHFATLSDATVTTAPVFYQQGHGRSVGDVVQLFPTRENAYLANGSVNMAQTSGGAGVPVYYMGYTYTISAVPDGDHFTLNLAGRVTPPGLVNILYAWAGEAGFSTSGAQADANHAALQATVWDAFDAAIGPARVVHSMGSQAADASHTSARLVNSAIALRTDHVHVAPYYNGAYWAASITGAGGTVVPRVYSSNAGTVWWGLYANGSTPTSLDIVKQQGTGFIAGGGAGGQTIVANAQGTGDGGWPALPAASALTDGTHYAAFVVYQEAGGNFWKIGTGTDSLNPAYVLSTVGSPVYLFDTAANQSARSRMSTLVAANYDAHAAAISAAGSSATVISYEGGQDLSLAGGTQMPQWLQNYATTTQGVAAVKHFFNHLARVGYRSLAYFMDISNSPKSSAYDFIANQDFTNTTDPRYVMLSAYGGLIPKQAAISSSVSSAKVSAAVTSAPGSFPATVFSGLDGGYTYAILGGDWTNNFAISGTTVTMVNATGINFSQYAPRTLLIEASDAYSSTTFQLTVPIGSAWYPADAQFVWDSVTATAGTTMVPPANLPFVTYGSTLSEVTGSGNPVITSSSGTVSNDLWKMTGYVFANGNGMSKTVQTNVPFMCLHVVDIGDQTLAFNYQVGIGAGSQSVSFGVGGSNTNSRWRVTVGGVNVINGLADIASNPAKGTKVIHWIFVDPVAGTAIAGVNQTAYSAAALSGLTIANQALGRDVRIGAANGGTTNTSAMYQGSVVFLSRAGLTQTNTLAIVQAAQTHHGI